MQHDTIDAAHTAYLLTCSYSWQASYRQSHQNKFYSFNKSYCTNYNLTLLHTEKQLFPLKLKASLSVSETWSDKLFPKSSK